MSSSVQDDVYGKVYSLLAVGDHLPQLVALLEEESEKEDGFRLTPTTLLPDPTSNPPHSSPLVQAAYTGCLEVVQFLVHRIPTLDFINHTDMVLFRSQSAVHHCTALLAACFNGHVRVARALLEAGASTEIEDCTGATPLCEAVFHGHLELVQLLHEHYGANCNAPNMFGWSPLHVAIDRGHRVIVGYLLDGTEASVTQTTPEGYTALHIAAMRGRASIVKKLLQMRTKVAEEEASRLQEPTSSSVHCLAGEYVPSPLYLAAANLRRNVVQLLMECAELPGVCSRRDAKLLQGAAKLEHGLDPMPLWREAFSGSAVRPTALERVVDSTVCAAQAAGSSATASGVVPLATDAYGSRQEMSFEDLTRLEQYHVPPQEIDVESHHRVENLYQVEKRYQAVFIRERCMGTRDPELFWQLSKLAEALWHRAADLLYIHSPRGEAVWLAVQQLWLRALRLYEEHHLCYLQRGHLLPQSVEGEVGRWGQEYIAAGLAVMNTSGKKHVHIAPEFGSYIEFLFKVLTTVKARAEALRVTYGCEVIVPRNLFQAIFLIFRAWIKFTALPCCSTKQASECECLGRKFVSENLRLPDGSTLLQEAVTMWCDLATLRSQPSHNHDHESDERLLTALLEWGAAAVINVATPTRGDTPVHHLCRIACQQSLHSTCTYLILLPILVSYGAHLDAVNSEGRTAHDIYCSKQGLSESVGAQLRPPTPPPLSCLVCHRMLTWGVVYARLHNCLPARLLRFVRLHDANKAYV